MKDCIRHTGCGANGGYGLKSLNGKLMGANRASNTELAEVYGVSRRTISDARSSKTRRHT